MRALLQLRIENRIARRISISARYRACALPVPDLEGRLQQRLRLAENKRIKKNANEFRWKIVLV